MTVFFVNCDFMKKINVYDDQEHLNEGFTAFVLALLNEKEAVNICLSGGSTPKAVFDYWSRVYKSVIPWSKIFFYWGDERCVPPTDELSNYGMTKKYLLDNIKIPEGNIFRIHGEDDPEKEAVRYGNILPSRFDLIILGIGEDGHTASIFPDNIRLWDSDARCVVSVQPETQIKRVTITGKVINSAENVAFLATGNKKAEIVRNILYDYQNYINQYPAARVHPGSGNLFWFLDHNAI